MANNKCFKSYQDKYIKVNFDANATPSYCDTTSKVHDIEAESIVIEDNINGVPIEQIIDGNNILPLNNVFTGVNRFTKILLLYSQDRSNMRGM